MDVSVIIVNYNTKELTKNCIDSIFGNTSGITFEVILVDNASTDGSVELFEKDDRIQFIECGENFGFGRANNLGYQFANGKYLFFLNSDTLLVNNAVKLFFDKMEVSDSKIGCLGCILKDYQHKPMHSYADFPTMGNLLFDTFPYLFKLFGFKPIKMDEPERRLHGDVFFQVDYITGADLFVRRSIIEQCGLFNPAFFMYYEDPELQFRYAKAGFFSYIYDVPQIIHLEGKSMKKEQNEHKRLISNHSKIIYLECTQPKWKVWLYKVLVFVCSKY